MDGSKIQEHQNIITQIRLKAKKTEYERDKIMSKKDGMYYAPKSVTKNVVKEGDFTFSVATMKHGHIWGMTQGLIDAGARLKYVYEEDETLLKQFTEKFPDAMVCTELETILNDDETKLVAGAAIASERAELGRKVMESGKDYFTDKAPFTSLEQIEMIENVIKRTNKKYIVYYSELSHVESAVYAGQLVEKGAIGKVVQVMNLGPHRLNEPSRPEWFFEKEKYGGILCDIGCHNIYQFLEYTDSDNAEVVRSAIGNYNNPKHPGLDDFGEASLVSEKGHSHYFRVDWFTPDGLPCWGDGRLLILGTKGYIEVRKYIDPGKSEKGDNVLLVNDEVEQFENVSGKVGFPFFYGIIMDCLNRTELAQSQHRAIEASRLSIIAQNNAACLSQKFN